MSEFERHIHATTQLIPDIILAVLDRYREPHRFYHNVNHVYRVYTRLMAKWENGTDTGRMILGLAALFHDAVYDPERTDNEEQSAELFESCTNYNTEVTESVIALILASGYKETRGMRSRFNNLIEAFLEADQETINTDLATMLDHSLSVSKEYGFIPYFVFVENHCEVIEKCWSKSKNGRPTWADHLKPLLLSRRPSIGIYPGSFNPFHLGHLDILNKASKLFDYVIVARGVNPAKVNPAKVNSTHVDPIHRRGVYGIKLAGVPKNFRVLGQIDYTLL